MNKIEQILPSKDKFHLFLMVGQSNMAGRGVVEDQDTIPHPGVLMLDQQQQWVPAVEPTHFDKDGVGVSSGRVFGIKLAEQDKDISIGLIPCACGGSPIDTWTPGSYHDQTESNPYDDTIIRAKYAQQFGTIKAILWHQGEGDCTSERAAVYEEKLIELFDRLKKELELPDDIPTIIGQMGYFYKAPWDDVVKQVDAAHQKIAKQLKKGAFVPSEGMSCNEDQVHFDAESQREFGRRYAAAYLELSKK